MKKIKCIGLFLENARALTSSNLEFMERYNILREI